MVKLSELSTAEEVHAKVLRDDAAVRHLQEENPLANKVAIELVRYRAERDLSQTQLADQLGMKQSAIARLEAGDHDPSMKMLTRLTQRLGITWSIAVDQEGVHLSAGHPKPAGWVPSAKGPDESPDSQIGSPRSSGQR